MGPPVVTAGAGREAPGATVAASRLEFHLLGPLTVLDGSGQPIDLGARKQRAVLALLLLEPGRVVSLDRIIQGLWADEAPSSATGTLQAYISQLRRVLEPHRSPRTPPTVLLTREPGYLLAVQPDQVDAIRFGDEVEAGRAELAQGRVAEAERILTTALSRWHGEPLPEFADEDFAAPAITRLVALRADATEDLIEARLALGRNATAATEAQALVDRYPFRERAWAQLMLALYRDGRQADALSAYRRARHILDTELGLPPGPQLRALEESILRHDPTLGLAPVTDPTVPETAVPDAAVPDTAVPDTALPDAAGAEAPVPPVGMLGRASQLAWVADRIAAASTGRGGLLFVAGHAGVGKTLLTEAAADMARGKGMFISWSRCFEGGTAPAFWPWIQVLRALPDDLGAERVLAQLSGQGHVAWRGDDPDTARFHLLEAIGDVIRAAARHRPTLLVIDDLHLADPSSLRQLAHLAGELNRLPLLVLATMRSEPSESDRLLRETLGALANQRGVERVSLQPFSLDDVRAYLVGSIGTEPAPDVVTALYERTGGNPFYLKELLRLLGSEHPAGWSSAQATAESAVPESVRDVISRRVSRLPEDTQALLRAAAVIGRDVDAVLLETAAGIDNERVMSLLEPAVATGLLVEVPQRWDYRFTHALVRDALYAELSRLQRSRIHRRVGEALEALGRADDPASIGLLAHHFAMAARIGAAD
ncbi:MAG TPA: BTAD domain-containing putative transcriptional regulator, partial [Micromonosporaceae bacterium]